MDGAQKKGFIQSLGSPLLQENEAAKLPRHHQTAHRGAKVNKTAGLAISGAAAILLSAFTTSSAQAAGTAYAGCSTTGASGAVKITNWNQPTSTVGLEFNLYDTGADGHHVRIRLVSKQYNGHMVSWP
ncbi:hypothetical protein ACWGI9_25420 [Streptomyces sp. NPDC054833]